MNTFKNKWIFIASVLLGVTCVLSMAAYRYWKRPPALPVKQLVAGISVSEQLKPHAVATLKAQGFATIIDLRPDGEAVDQPSSSEIGKEAKRSGMQFFYAPVPHGDIPENAVARLNTVLSTAPRPVLLYCRSGRRAARTWGLVEASRPNGLDAASILAVVKAAGQSADDLNGDISQRIAQRKPTSGEIQ